jgi:uncharacterized phage protein (TIGR02218 family)
MKSVAASLQTALSDGVSMLATCWLITRRDEVQLGFTDFDQDLIIDGVTYQAATGFTASNVDSGLDATPSNIEIASFLSADAISEADLSSGVYDYARIHVFRVDCFNLPSSLSASPAQYLTRLRGFLGQVRLSDQTFTVEVESLQKLLETKTSALTSSTCRYKFGDSNCNANVAAFTYGMSVNAPGAEPYFFTSNLSFEDNFLAGGLLTWTTGDNAGLESMITQSNGQNIWLAYTPPNPIQAGDQFNAIPGCQKTWRDCGQFNNTANFGGEKDIPGTDQYFSSGYENS